MTPGRDLTGATADDLDPTSALLDAVLAADPADQHALLERLTEEHPDRAGELRDRFSALESLGFLDDTDDPGEGMAIPDRIGDFALRERLGVGGMGVVYRAHQESLGRDVALKLVRPDFAFFDTQRRRFQREAAAVARLDHPHIVPIFSVGECRGIPYLAMQRVDGITLAELIAELQTPAASDRDATTMVDALARRVDVDRAAVLEAVGGAGANWNTVVASLLTPIADALAHAHARGIMHRDVKPSNIMVARTGRPLLVDFGLAMLEGHAGSITRSGAFLGSLAYMSPEQIGGGKADQRSDVFALGCVLYELLALRPAFEAPAASHTLQQIAFHEPTDLARIIPWVDPDLAAVVAKCLEKKPEHRYQSPAALADDLRAVLARRPVTAARLTPWLRAVRFARREPVRAWLYGVSAAAVLALAGAGGYLLAMQSEIVAGRDVLALERREAALAHGFLDLMQGRHDEARATLADLLASEPGLIEARWGMARAELAEPPTPPPDTAPGATTFLAAAEILSRPSAHDPVEATRAVELLQQAILQTPSARLLYHAMLSRAAGLAGDHETLRRAADGLTTLWPDLGIAHYWAGWSLVQHRPRAARRHLVRATRLTPEFAPAHADLGVTHIALGEPGRAVAPLERAAELNPDDCEVWINLGLARHQLDDHEAAVAALRRATHVPRPLPGAFFNLGVVLMHRDVDAAKAAFTETVRHQPKYARAWQNLGTLRLQDGDTHGAVDAFTRLTEIEPESASAFRSLGAAHAHDGDARSAAAAYQRVTRLDPTDRDSHDYLCRLLEHLGDTEALTAERERFARAIGRHGEGP